MNLNNDIQESYCSFEVSTLLKDKGFVVDCYSAYISRDYDYQNPRDHHVTYYKKGEVKYADRGQVFNNLGTDISRPTHALAIEWIRINFSYHIFPTPDLADSFTLKTWGYFIYNLNYAMRNHYKPPMEEKYNTPQEAIEAALLYILTKILK